MDDDDDYPEIPLSIDFEWRLVCAVERVLDQHPELRPIVWRVVRDLR